MDTLDLARWQFAITTVYHFLFVPITIGMSGRAREAGATVVGVATVVDRATGAQQAIETEGVPYRALLGLADLGLG